ncbi:hypothetical protein BDU57DRAFT_524491 [Ampelomyces quisqualis]|uniref:Uncharacterized protein n=1 Tax=Ampelomyces quisqualis TaxID=50730 RepID=A0A6A5Q9D1_AMPQU|nr:hypothetical protein BDU57DRAFT_524491 [Ampelomyces quisqualis]
MRCKRGTPASGDGVTQGFITPQNNSVDQPSGAQPKAEGTPAFCRLQPILVLRKSFQSLGTVTLSSRKHPAVHGPCCNCTLYRQPPSWNTCLPVVPSEHPHRSCLFRVIFVSCAELHSSDHPAALHPITPLRARSSLVHIRSEAERRRHDASY